MVDLLSSGRLVSKGRGSPCVLLEASWTMIPSGELSTSVRCGSDKVEGETEIWGSVGVHETSIKVGGIVASKETAGTAGSSAVCVAWGWS